MKPAPTTPALISTVTTTRDPQRRRELDQVIRRTLAGEFAPRPLLNAAD